MAFIAKIIQVTIGHIKHFVVIFITVIEVILNMTEGVHNLVIQPDAYRWKSPDNPFINNRLEPQMRILLDCDKGPGTMIMLRYQIAT